MSKELLRIVYPRRCPGCGSAIAPDMLVCDICRPLFKRMQPPFCMKCGRHIGDDAEQFCTECKNKEHHYNSGIAVFGYDSVVKRAMSDLKFGSCRENAEFFAAEAVSGFGLLIKSLHPSVLIPVPVHFTKRAYRGYNQAELIAKHIGDALGIPVVTDLLQRSRRTKAQKVLNSQMRSENLHGAFGCNMKKYSRLEIEEKYPTVLLVDDIYTTGATMENCTLALLGAGVGKVDIFSVAIGMSY